MSSDSQTGKALIVLSLLCLGLGAVLQVHWLTVVGGVGLVGWYIDFSLLPTLRKRWHELLDAIRGKRQDEAESSASKEGVHSGIIPREGIFAIPPEPTPEELERARKAMQKREAEGYAALAEREHEAVLEQEHKKQADEKREQEAALGGATVSEECPIIRDLQQLHRLLHSVADVTITNTVVSDQDVLEFYNENRTQFNVAEPQHRLAKIVVTPRKSPQVCNRKNDDATNEFEARRKCAMLIERLNNGADFAQLAMDYSEEPASAAVGGDNGYISESALSQVAPAVKEAVLALKPGQLSVIEVRGEYLILKLVSREVPGHRELTDPTVQWHIRYFLRNSKRFLRVACSEADKRVDEIVEAFSDSLKEEPSYIGLAALYQLLMIAVRNIERVNAETKGFNSGDKQFLRDMGIAP